MPMEAGDIELIVRIILQIVLLSGSAIFSGSETALFSLGKKGVEELLEEHEQVEMTFQVSDIPLRSSLPDNPGSLVADLDGYHMRFHPPTSRDFLVVADRLATGGGQKRSDRSSCLAKSGRLAACPLLLKDSG